MFSILALIFLFISLLCSAQEALRGYGIVSAILYCIAYSNDIVILITNVMILLAHIKWLISEGMTWRSLLNYMKLW